MRNAGETLAARYAMSSNARDIAVDALRDRAGNISARLRRLAAESDLSAADRGLAVELALGVVRRRGTLRAVLEAFLDAPKRHLPAPLAEILHVALYQMLFLDRVPDFAAVSEAVEQARRWHHKRQSGFVNGVLRAVQRELSEPRAGPPPRTPHAVPVGPSRYRTVQRAVFADPAASPARYLAGAWSLPEALARRWIEREGLDEAVALAAHAAARAAQVLRVNRLRAGPDDVLRRLADAGQPARLHANGQSVVLDTHADLTALAVFREGLVQPQDASATDVVTAAEVQPGMAVLDFCAAPGTKTTHVAECMEDRGRIVAVDVSDEKLARVVENCRRLGVSIVEPLRADRIGSLKPGSFDVVLADVPCSNTGVLARRPEARWRFDEAALPALAADQRDLASAAAAFVRPGGRLVYSTCSIEPEENEQVARGLDRRRSNVALERSEPTPPAGADEPTRWRDGGYRAIFRGR